MATIRELINGLLNDFNEIIVMRYIGDNSIGADLDEDYEVAGTYKGMNEMPDYIKGIRVEYFGLKDGNLIIYMEQ